MRALVFVALLASFSVQAAPASQESVESLLTVTKTEALIESMYAGMDQMMRQSLNEAFRGKSLNEEQQLAVNTIVTRSLAVMKEEISWQKVKPLYVELYRETFVQSEVDGMLAFYASPAGKAVIEKMPIVMQRSMALSQSVLQSMMPKMKTAMDDALKEANAAGRK